MKTKPKLRDILVSSGLTPSSAESAEKAATDSQKEKLLNAKDRREIRTILGDIREAQNLNKKSPQIYIN